MKIALVHDYLKEFGGAERVLEALHEVWPEAPIYTAFVDFQGLGPHAQRIRTWNIHESWVSRVWPVKKYISAFRFLTPSIWNSFDFSGYDVVLTSSSWFMPKGVLVKSPTVHICYLHTPPRYLYGYQTARGWQKYWPIRLYAYLINHNLRIYDFESSMRVDYFIANSEETRRRIEKFYRRDATVIYPPVNIPKRGALAKRPLSSMFGLPEQYYLVVSRIARAKHIDVAIAACQKLKKNLVIIGKGADEERLKEIINKYELRITNSQSKIVMLGEVSDDELPGLYANAEALLFPAEDEEFGIVPVEAMGYGTPVIAYRSGGVVETIIEGKTGTLFDTLSADSLAHAMKNWEHTSTARHRAIHDACRTRAREFSKEVFKKRIIEFVKKHG